MAKVLIISGAGYYSDPWHPFADTSQRLAGIITGLGHHVAVSEAVEESLAEPGDPDLIVVNIGNPRETRPQSRIDAAEQGLDRHLQRGGALLGVHVSATSMTTMSEWSQMLGGHWVRGRTMHPKQDLATVVVRPDAHPIARGLTDFTVFDERFSASSRPMAGCTQSCGRASPDLLGWSTTASATTPGPTKARATSTCFAVPWGGS
jgi:type 1 glutamine amidotransferase